MGRKTIVILVAAVAVLVLGGIFWWNNKDASAPSPNSASSSQASTEDEAHDHASSQDNSTDNTVHTGQVTVNISNFAFVPSNVTIKKGSTVVWTNQDSTAHTITPDNPSSADGFGSEELSKGESYSFMFSSAGTFAYHCAIHPSMTGSVTVVE